MKVPKSLAWRVGGMVGVFCAVLVFLIAIGTDHLLRLALDKRAKTELIGKMEVLQQVLNANTSTDESKLSAQLVGHPYLHWALVSDSTVLKSSDPFAREQALAQARPQSKWIAGVFARKNNLGDPILLGIQAHPTQAQWLLVFLERESDQKLLLLFRQSQALALPFAVLFIALGSWLVAKRALQPLQTFNALVSSVTAASLHARLGIEAVPTELQELAISFNGMLQRLENSVERLSQFSADLAHEMRTPLSNVLGDIQVNLSKTREVADYQRVLASAEEELLRLNRLINDLLFLANAEQAEQALNLEEIDLKPLIEMLFDFFDALAESKNIQLLASGSGQILADKSMLQRALTNLLSNAIRHADLASKITVDIEQDAHRLLISISNQGEVIAADHLAHLFERFYRVDSARSRNDGGSGLGLAIISSIMQLHHGEVTVKSHANTTTFCLKFYDVAGCR
ncbi:heavy metal sensor histidine kinase [Iodobacter sp. HSC-16F04]|uniref:Sensor protein n=1 Tax=Iodobacter violaceini TaxID=3044271 RepID=A0ABX0KSU5_9NEIS|nr:heavy metal sensor histidine kinase [Iodobacter violacea]NHQ87730.1 heavy metal sensor histidine kinase [Iodobacter violacea]